LRDLRTEELSPEAVRLAMPSSHPFARRKVISLEKAAREPFVVYSRSEYPDYHEWFESIFVGIAQKPRIVEEHDGASSLLPAVEAGIGVALGGFPAGVSGIRFKHCASNRNRRRWHSVSPRPRIPRFSVRAILGVGRPGSFGEVTQAAAMRQRPSMRPFQAALSDCSMVLGLSLFRITVSKPRGKSVAGEVSHLKPEPGAAD
jgi:DNA-binding transcriptional LysR family regulator